MRTLLPLERQILVTLDSTKKRWWTTSDLWEEMNSQPGDNYPYASINSALGVMRRNDLVTYDGRNGSVYAITTIGAMALRSPTRA